jgi:hypothetical protein
MAVTTGEPHRRERHNSALKSYLNFYLKSISNLSLESSLNFLLKSISNLRKFLYGKLFLTSNLSQPYFILNILSPRRPVLERNKFASVCKIKF